MRKLLFFTGILLFLIAAWLVWTGTLRAQQVAAEFPPITKEFWVGDKTGSFSFGLAEGGYRLLQAGAGLFLAIVGYHFVHAGGRND